MIKSWMVIGAVVLIVALAINRISTSDIQWFNRLVRPRWLKIEAAIPIIWTVIFICGAWSAVIVWEQAPGYTSVMCKVRSLKVGTIIGGTGAILSVLLALSVLAASESATLLLLPYILWSPIGTYTTWAMMHLNPADV
ncbi:MAG: TspO protein [Oscillatoriales cyanobacterium]|nr:MAG: TspO protein [Oscillatoriales cyanobacterium]